MAKDLRDFDGGTLVVDTAHTLKSGGVVRREKTAAPKKSHVSSAPVSRQKPLKPKKKKQKKHSIEENSTKLWFKALERGRFKRDFSNAVGQIRKMSPFYYLQNDGNGAFIGENRDHTVPRTRRAFLYAAKLPIRPFWAAADLFRSLWSLSISLELPYLRNEKGHSSGLNRVFYLLNGLKTSAINLVILGATLLPVAINTHAHYRAFTQPDVTVENMIDAQRTSFNDGISYFTDFFPREALENVLEKMKRDNVFMDVLPYLDPISHPNTNDYIKAFFLENYTRDANAMSRMRAYLSAALTGDAQQGVDPVSLYMVSRKERAYITIGDERVQERTDTGGISNTRTQFQYIPRTALAEIKRQYDEGILLENLENHPNYASIEITVLGLLNDYDHYYRLYGKRSDFIEIQGRDTVTENFQAILTDSIFQGVLVRNSLQDIVEKLNKRYPSLNLSISIDDAANQTPEEKARTFALVYSVWQQGNFKFVDGYLNTPNESVEGFGPVGNKHDWRKNGGNGPYKTYAEAYADFYALGLIAAKEVMPSEESYKKAREEGHMVYYTGSEEDRWKYSLEENMPNWGESLFGDANPGRLMSEASKALPAQEDWHPAIGWYVDTVFDLSKKMDVVTPVSQGFNSLRFGSEQNSISEAEGNSSSNDGYKDLGVQEELTLISSQKPDLFDAYLVRHGIAIENAQKFEAQYIAGNFEAANTELAWPLQLKLKKGDDVAPETLLFVIEALEWQKQQGRLSSDSQQRLDSLKAGLDKIMPKASKDDEASLRKPRTQLASFIQEP